MISIIERAMAEHERKAWDSLARYKFLMFGYHAANWVTLKKLLPSGPKRNQPNPWSELVKMAQRLFENAGVATADSFPQSESEQEAADISMAHFKGMAD